MGGPGGQGPVPRQGPACVGGLGPQEWRSDPGPWGSVGGECDSPILRLKSHSRKLTTSEYRLQWKRGCPGVIYVKKKLPSLARPPPPQILQGLGNQIYPPPGLQNPPSSSGGVESGSTS